MREGISIEVSASDRERLAAVVADRNSPQKHVWRSRIILATAEGCGTAEIMHRAEVSKPCVWRWQERFMREGVAGLLRDKTRKPGLPPLPPTVIDRVVKLTLAEPPGEATHWTGRAMAAASGISLRSVQRIWAAHGLQPHRVRRFKLSQDPAFAAKLRDVLEYHNFILQHYFQLPPVDYQQVLESNLELGERLKPLVADVTGILEQLSSEGSNVLFEGAQGAMLDVDLGTYPYVTSSTTTAGGAAPG